LEEFDPDAPNWHPEDCRYFLRKYCYETSSLRIRRSVFKGENRGEEFARNYIHVVVTNGPQMYSKIRFPAEDLKNVIKVLECLQEEISE